jgi:hypothetical protein
VGRKLRNAKLTYHREAAPAKTTEERIGFRPEVDDPLSPGFIQLPERSEVGQARWWAMREKRKGRTAAAGVFDG